jgi:hypothetical protein
MRLEKEKEILAEQRLRTYFLRRRWDPNYSYPGVQEDIALSRRKLRERDQTLSLNDRGVGL